MTSAPGWDLGGTHLHVGLGWILTGIFLGQESRLLSFINLSFFFFLIFLILKFYVFWPSSVTCGILVLQPGMEPVPLHWKLRVLTTGPLGKSQAAFLAVSTSPPDFHPLFSLQPWPYVMGSTWTRKKQSSSKTTQGASGRAWSRFRDPGKSCRGTPCPHTFPPRFNIPS